MKVERLKTDEYKNLIATEVFPVDDFSRTLGKFRIGNKDFKLAWRSNIIEPTIKHLNDLLLFVGIDNYIAVVNKNTSELIMKMELQWNFLDITDLFNDRYYVLTELSVLKFNSSDFSLLSEKTMPDIINNIQFLDNSIKVECMDGCLYNI